MCAPVKNPELNIKFILEMLFDIFDYIGLGGCSQTHYRRNRRFTCSFSDKTTNVAVIRTKIMTPFRKAVRFIQYPSADFTLIYHPANSGAAQLLWRNKKNAGIAEAHPVQCVGSFG